MANRFCNLNGSKKISEDFNNINIGFDRVQQDVDNQTTKSNDLQSQIDAHKASSTAHTAEQIVYSPGKSMKQKEDEQDAQILNLTSGPAPNAAEIIDARMGADAVVRPSLGTMTREMHADQLPKAPVSVSLKPGIQSITVPRDTPYNVLNIRGRTLTNVTGRDGGCESLAPFAITGAVTLSTTQKRSGNNSLKFTAAGSAAFVTKDYAYSLDPTKQYVLAGWVYVESWTSGGLTFSLRDVGTSTLRYGGTINTATIGSWQFVYVKIPTANTLVGTGFRLMLGPSGAGTSVAYFDEIRLYELSTADSNAIGTTLTTGAQIDAFIPYVDDIKPVYAPFVYKYGKNLLPPFTEWTLHANATVVSPYSLFINSSAANQNSFSPKIPAVPGQTYTMSGNVTANYYYVIREHKQDGSQVSTTFNSGASRTITLSSEAKELEIVAVTSAVSTFTWNNPQLEIGTVATSFVQRNDDYLFFPDLRLHSNVDGTVYDQLYVDGNGQYRKLARFIEVVLDGSLAWSFNDSATGYKRIRVTSGLSAPVQYGDAYAAKYDGKVLKNRKGDTSAAGPDVFYVYNASDICSFYIAAADSGWTDAINPNTNAIKALMNGWKTNGNNGTIYNSWVSVLDGSAPPTNTEAYVSANKAPNWSGWGKLTYQLAQSDNTEIVVPEGDITLHEGANQLEVGCGVIVRERANPTTDTGNYYINNDPAKYPSGGDSRLRFRAMRILTVYRNRTPDSRFATDNHSSSYGAARAFCDARFYDPSAVYEVTYLALDTYALGIVPQSISGEYAPNMRGTVDGTARRQAEVITRLSVLERSSASKAQPQWIAPTLLSMWENFGGSFATAGYYKDDTGVIRLKGYIKSGSTTINTVLFVLPPGYRPSSFEGFSVYTNDGSIAGVVQIGSNGNVIFIAGGNQSLSLSGISFRAAQ